MNLIFQHPLTLIIYLNLNFLALSNGQFKKIIILKQLLDNLPKILLLDYPFEGLDHTSRSELKEFLDHLAIRHRIQLIIADQDHPQLPDIITKRIELSSSSGVITEPKNEFHSTVFLKILFPQKKLSLWLKCVVLKFSMAIR
jgi:ABC-type Mn2+/Zn2+ transport system ATPase subunit